MDAYYELFDLDSGNVIEDYDRERDAIDALIQVVLEHGAQAIATFALTYMESGKPILIAMQEDLIERVQHEMTRLAIARSETA
jgi:hypothetical protein